jgi:hypothetical protein
MMDDRRIADLTDLDHRIRDVMLSGRIKSVLPMSVIDEGGRALGVYSTEGMTCISDGRYAPLNLLELVGRIVKMTDELKDILIYPDEIVFSGKVIFIDPSVRMTRICVIPQNKEKVYPKENVSCLLKEIKELTDERGKAYMDVIIDRYINGDLSTDRMLGLIEELKREAGM